MSRARRIYRKKIVRLIPYGVFVFIPVVFFLLLIPMITSDKKDDENVIVSPLASNTGIRAIANAIPDILTGNKNEKIKEIVDEELRGEKGTYSIVYKNLKNGDFYAYQSDRVYESASLYKLFVMGKTYEAIQAGDLTHETVLSDTVQRLNERFDIASDEAELNEGSFKMTTDTALEQMITISHNYAALLLSSTLKSSVIKEFIARNGFVHTDFEAPPKTTAEDIALFYEKLYKKQLVTPSASEDMISLLKRQELNDRIPKYLPKSIQVAHKTGELGGVKHDAGIVFTPEGDYILVMMSESGAPQHAAEVEARISEKIYNLVAE